MKQCHNCGEWKDESEFHRDKHKKDGLVYYCKDCISERGKQYRKNHLNDISVRNTERYKNQKEFLEKLKTPCVKCGESRSYLIQFHHINPTNKDRGVASGLICCSKERIIGEVRKCICLCSNCHIEYHWFYGKHPVESIKSLNEYLGGGLNEIQLQQDRMLEEMSLSV